MENRIGDLKKKQKKKEKLFQENQDYNLKQMQIMGEKHRARQMKRDMAIEQIRKLERDHVRGSMLISLGKKSQSIL